MATLNPFREKIEQWGYTFDGKGTFCLRMVHANIETLIPLSPEVAKHWEHLLMACSGAERDAINENVYWFRVEFRDPPG